MIQRVQSIYLLHCILCLGSLLFNIPIVDFQSDEFYYSISALHIVNTDIASSEVISKNFHFGGLILFVLLVSAILTLVQFKDLKKQFKLGRSLFFTYLLVLIGTMLWISFGENSIDSDIKTRHLGLGFLIFVVGFPFTFLANIGIKRDKTLLESLDRLR
ncbi:MAG: DUF4293 domain-containing protein [Bacteroidetes bacterium]|nr:DUF4293 domain-containing protein [Bacteroidota bacterium]